MRLFVSVDLPEALTAPIEAIQADLSAAGGLTFTDPEQAHLTLKFLGETDPSRLGDLEEAIGAAVDTAGVDPFKARVAGIGAFPSESYIRVVWLGVDAGADAFRRLHERLEERTVDLGFDPESHEFTPHVTIARMNHAEGKSIVQSYLEDHDPDIGSMTVEAVHLTESELTPDGPSYRTLERFPL